VLELGGRGLERGHDRVLAHGMLEGHREQV